MGYHVSIVRGTSNRQAPIQAEEVERLARQFDASVVAPSLEGSDLELVLSQQDGGFRLVLTNGELWGISPSSGELSTMIRIADALDARVRGDEGETYRTPTETYQHPDDCDSQALSRVVSGKRRRGIAMNAAIIFFFVAMALLVHFVTR